MRLTIDEFIDKFKDEVFGAMIMPKPIEEQGYGIAIRGRMVKVDDLLRRMYNSLAPVPASLPPTEIKEPPTNGKHGPDTLTFKPQVKK